MLHRDDVLALRSLCRDIAVAEPVVRYASRLVGASAPESTSAPGHRPARASATARACAAASRWCLAAKAVALLEGRAQVAFADIQRVALPVLRHRLIRSFEGEADGITTDQVIRQLVETVATRPEPVERAVQDR